LAWSMGSPSSFKISATVGMPHVFDTGMHPSSERKGRSAMAPRIPPHGDGEYVTMPLGFMA